MLKYLIFLLAFFITYQAVSAQHKDIPNEMILVTEKRDVTGDNIPDRLVIKGLKYEEDAEFLKEITLYVDTGEKKFELPLSSGYKPAIQFVDVNKDGVEDVFITTETGGILNSFLFSFKDQMMKDLTVPKTVSITAQFLDNYQAKVTINGKKLLVIDLSDRKEEYEQSGIYTNGILNEATELLVDGFSTLKPVFLIGKGKGLVGIQLVSGVYHADEIALVESKWSYEKGKWKLIKANIKPLQTE
ncbi:hypothetical protein AC625_10260 [Peribacillus loiseleuriae]|uniref:Spore coat protein n=2 Tax=Peribacillus loiseleuriae TaxID=1679170 RepID=A0A0K9GZZ9_9BACI|nr:hypothetical protein AC625_10260 [Peribacillus loiseleuriae]